MVEMDKSPLDSADSEATKVLIVDDQRDMCELLKTDLKLRGYESEYALNAKDAQSLIGRQDFDVVITDVRMPGASGLELCRELHQSRPDIPVIVMTAFGSMETAVSAMRSGAYDFVTKPIELEMVAMTIRRAAERRRLGRQVRLLSEQIASPVEFENMIGQSPVMLELYDTLARVADSDASVLISGESGTGKERVARAIHQKSKRSKKPFIAINCGAISETLLESELFGHKKGAFTDAQSDRKGLFEQADGGTILLDEIGDMPTPMQVKVLRVLEERRVRPVGGTREIDFDVRVLAASHRDLESEIESGTFREDLYYRINVINIYLPPLRSRGADVLLIAKYFLDNFASASQKKIHEFDEAVAERLMTYSWPGNIRELRNVVERAVALAKHDRITVEDLPAKIREFRSKAVFLGGDDPAELVSLDEIERRYIDHVLEAVDQNQTQAAKILGIDRKTLYRKLKQDR